MAAPPADTVSIPLIALPEVLLYGILTYAAAPTDMAAVLCHQLAPTSSTVQCAVESGLPGVWTAILSGGYGGTTSAAAAARPSAPLRTSKRFRRDPKALVESSHRLLVDRTAVAHYALTEMSMSSRTSLTLARLRWIFREYGPTLLVNSRLDVGGTFLVEVCRARHVTEAVVLRCVRELVERHGANVDIASASDPRLRLTPLVVAAARGMPSVVRYLLRPDVGASPDLCGTGRFRLHCRPSKSILTTGCTPLVFAQTIRKAEVANGADKESLKNLDQCISFLAGAMRKNRTDS